MSYIGRDLPASWSSPFTVVTPAFTTHGPRGFACLGRDHWRHFSSWVHTGLNLPALPGAGR